MIHVVKFGKNTVPVKHGRMYDRGRGFWVMGNATVCPPTVSHVFLLCSHTGQQNLFLGRVTPPGLVIIDPPEKLVLEVESSGGFARLGWARNNVGFSFAADAEFPATTDRFINFYEIYVRDPTDTSHLGEYEVEVVAANFAQNQPADVVFIVVPYGKLQHGCCQHRFAL